MKKTRSGLSEPMRAQQPDTQRRKKVFAIASPGGHWIQLNKICRPLEKRFDIVYVTPAAAYSSGNESQAASLTASDSTTVKSADAGTGRRIIRIVDASADSKWRLIPLTLQLLWLFIRERPSVIISTGAAPGAIAILLAKFLPIRTVWVDSIANVSQLSRSGRMVKGHADRVITQWQKLSDEKSVFYRGSIL